jgi:hypothetical protein
LFPPILSRSLFPVYYFPLVVSRQLHSRSLFLAKFSPLVLSRSLFLAKIFFNKGQESRQAKIFFYININIFPIYIQKYSSPQLKTLQINENIMFSGARCLKHTQTVDGRVRVAGASMLYPADTITFPGGRRGSSLSTRARQRPRFPHVASAGYNLG